MADAAMLASTIAALMPSSRHQYPLWVRAHAEAKWHYGCVAKSAREAMLLQTHIREEYPRMCVRVERVAAGLILPPDEFNPEK